MAAMLALALLAMAPTPQDYLAQSEIVTAGNPFDAIYAAGTGIGYDATAGLLITKATGTFLCTGSLVGHGRTVVTAAHCLEGALSVQAVFFPPTGGALVLTSTRYVIHPGYTGNVIDENDIAILTLPTAATGIDPYGLYADDPLGQIYNQVGFGRSGDGNTGAVIESGLRRQAWNQFDFAGDDPRFLGLFSDQHVLFADFDNGLAAQDASCRLTAFFFTDPICNLGLGPYEGLSGSGDSGGPLLVDHRLAAVTSFGLTFGGGIVGDIDGALNSTFGEFAGFVPISLHTDWIAEYITPEPATLLLLATGLALMFAFRRRQESN